MTDQEWERVKWEKKLFDMIENYGDERARAAYHGEHHCRVSPAILFKEIKTMIESA